MANKGGAAPYRKGAQHEREVAGEVRAAGGFAIRSPQSGSAIDVLAVFEDGYLKGGTLWWIQAKLAGRIRPAERSDVVALAQRYGGVPVLAYGRNPIRYRDLVTGEDIELPNPR